MSEFDFIETVRRTLAETLPANARLPIPPGDDCALVQGTAPYLFAADMLLEGVHFDLRRTTPELVGRKALAVNLSDIAAMAGTPTSVTVCLALPRRGGAQLGTRVMAGIVSLAKSYDVAVAGGDTNSWDGPLVVSVAITGSPHPRGSVTRQGARPGDVIFVTGALGGSLDSGRHLTFEPRLREATLLHARYGLTAMLDVSDGLAADLGHILEGSGVAARLTRGALPIHAAAQTAGDPLAAAMGDGEDFELCFTIDPAVAARLESERPLGDSVKVTKIGTVLARSEQSTSRLFWDDGSSVDPRGYSHSLD